MDKFLNFEKSEMEELKKVILRHFESMKKEFAPSLDLVTTDFVDRHCNRFLLEIKAEYLLDQKAIQEGYESAADKHFKIAKDAADKAATEKAEAELKQRLADEKEAEILKVAALREKAAKELRDEQDAQRVAELKAQLKAESLGKDQVKI